MKTPRELLYLTVRNLMANARYHRSLGDRDVCRRLVAEARRIAREARRA